MSVRGGEPMTYAAGQFAGAQVVLHGQRFRHVGHRLVDLLQVLALVLHLGEQKSRHSETHDNTGGGWGGISIWESTYLTSQHVGILQVLVNLTVLQVILCLSSFHLLLMLLLVLQL